MPNANAASAGGHPGHDRPLATFDKAAEGRDRDAGKFCEFRELLDAVAREGTCLIIGKAGTQDCHRFISCALALAEE
jgi:hypothetical protein